MNHDNIKPLKSANFPFKKLPSPSKPPGIEVFPTSTVPPGAPRPSPKVVAAVPLASNRQLSLVLEVLWVHIWGVPKNGGTQQPWVFLLKMIILGCLGENPTILGNLHMSSIVLWPTTRTTMSALEILMAVFDCIVNIFGCFQTSTVFPITMMVSKRNLLFQGLICKWTMLAFSGDSRLISQMPPKWQATRWRNCCRDSLEQARSLGSRWSTVRLVACNRFFVKCHDEFQGYQLVPILRIPMDEMEDDYLQKLECHPNHKFQNHPTENLVLLIHKPKKELAAENFNFFAISPKNLWQNLEDAFLGGHQVLYLPCWFSSALGLLHKLILSGGVEWKCFHPNASENLFFGRFWGWNRSYSSWT